MRSSDLLREKKEARRCSDPAKDTHRDRLTYDKVTSGESHYFRFKLNMKPNKTDQAGIKGTVKTFPIVEADNVLSAGKALLDMLYGDKFSDDPKELPLFRHENTGKEYTYDESNIRLKEIIKKNRRHR